MGGSTPPTAQFSLFSNPQTATAMKLNKLNTTESRHRVYDVTEVGKLRLLTVTFSLLTTEVTEEDLAQKKCSSTQVHAQALRIANLPEQGGPLTAANAFEVGLELSSKALADLIAGSLPFLFRDVDLIEKSDNPRPLFDIKAVLENPDFDDPNPQP